MADLIDRAALREVLSESWPEDEFIKARVFTFALIDDMKPSQATEPCPDDEIESAESLIPYGQPCPICGPKGHARHEDDSYGMCITCREYVPHTDDEFVGVRFPCPPVRLAHAATEPRIHKLVTDWSVTGDARTFCLCDCPNARR